MASITVGTMEFRSFSIFDQFLFDLLFLESPHADQVLSMLITTNTSFYFSSIPLETVFNDTRTSVLIYLRLSSAVLCIFDDNVFLKKERIQYFHGQNDTN